MKKFLFLLFSFGLMALMLTGCKESPPEFQLEFIGNVVEAKTHTTTDFKVATTNVESNYFAAGEVLAYPKLTQAAYPDAYAWVKDKAFAGVPNGATYDISVTGYIEWLGVKLTIDEHWNNNTLALNYVIFEPQTPITILPYQKRLFAHCDYTNFRVFNFDYVGY